MEMPEAKANSTKRQVWNAGRAVGAKRALKPKQIWEIRFFPDQQRRLRDRALFDLAIDSKLRGCDLVRMKIGDVVSGGQIRTRAVIIQQKTGRQVQFKLLSDARSSLLACSNVGVARWKIISSQAGSIATSSKHPPVCAACRQRGDWRAPDAHRIWHPLATPNKGFNHLPGDRQPARCPDSARPQQDRKYGSLSRHRRGGRTCAC